MDLALGWSLTFLFPALFSLFPLSWVDKFVYQGVCPIVCFKNERWGVVAAVVVVKFVYRGVAERARV